VRKNRSMAAWGPEEDDIENHSSSPEMGGKKRIAWLWGSNKSGRSAIKKPKKSKKKLWEEKEATGEKDYLS